jgi:hypothetical protein
MLVRIVARLCVSCREEFEREATHALLVTYREAVGKFREDVTSLADAVTAGPLEADSFEKMLTQCEKSHLVCIELLSELKSRE